MEGDAGTRQLNPAGGQERSDPGKDSDADTAPDDAVAKPDESLAVSTEELTEKAETTEEFPEPADDGRPSRLGVGWVAGICAALLMLAAGAAVGGYLALRSNDQSDAIERADAAALAAAKDCVAATHAPDTATMTAAQSKIIECFSSDMTAQASLYSAVFVDAYQAADVKVAVSDMRAAVEKHHDDGTVDVLVAVRVKVTNSEVKDQEQGYRLRVKMTPVEGAYKVANIDQVTSS
jgi:Mce-associated membrane protein